MADGDDYLIPKDIPWEAGTNRFASQKGMNPIGGRRDNVVKTDSTEKEFRQGEGEGDIPKLYNFINFKAPSQSGQSPFGGSGLQVKYMEEGAEVKQAGTELAVDSQSFLSKWAQPNPNAKNDGFGGKREATQTVEEGSTQLSEEDRLKCEGVLPRLQDMSLVETPTGAGAGIAGCGLPRQVTTMIDGLDLTEEEEMASRKVMPWTSGPMLMSTQSRSGGFNKPRDVTGRDPYAKDGTKKPAGINQASHGFLPLLCRPNPHASNAHIGRASRAVLYQNPILKDVPKYLKEDESN